MKAATTQLKNLLRQGYEIFAIPKLSVEWEHNRFSPFTDVDNPVTVEPELSDDLEWNDIYDLASIAEPNRPRTGIAKARFDENSRMKMSGKYRDIPQSARYYLSSQDDIYRYWSSYEKTGIVNNGGNYNFEEPIVLSIVHAEQIRSNKIVVGFDLSYATPTSYTVEVSTNGTSWSPVATTPPIDVDGRITLWRRSTGAWDTVKTELKPHQITALAKIQGVRITVYSMNKASVHLDVIQLGARLEADLSDYVEDYDCDFEVSNRSFVSPLGAASSNQGSVSLSNMDGIFNDDKKTSPFFGLINKKAKFTMDVAYDARPTGGKVEERIRAFTMWVDSWSGQDDLTVEVSLKDSSLFLQEIESPKVFWGSPAPSNSDAADFSSSMTVGAIIWQLLDLAGFSNYAYSRTELDNGQLVPYYWPESESTIWDEIARLAEGTQTAVYFDEYDVLQIKTRKAMFSDRETIDWNLDAIKNGTKLPDIVELNVNDELVANDITINYKPAKYSDFQNGFPKMETAWEPEDDTLTLRASALTRDLLTTHDALWIKYNEVAFWPYEALVNIRGEILRYAGKEYVWRKADGTLGYDMVYSPEDKAKFDRLSDPNRAYQNSWSGKLGIKERGINSSGIANHIVRPSNYTSKVTNYWNTVFYPLAPNTGMNYFDGVLTLVPPGYVSVHEYMLLQHETPVPTNNLSVGARIRFPSAQIQGDQWTTAGIFFSGDWGDAGYYLEISPTHTIADVEKRTWRNELHLQRMPGNMPSVGVVGDGHGDVKGFTADIKYDVWYDIDIKRVRVPGNADRISVYLNGVLAGSWTIPAHLSVVGTDQGLFGVFTRWQSKADFEYLYALDLDGRQYITEEPDTSSYLDNKTGGYTSGYIERDWRYGYYTTVNRGPAHEGYHLFVQQRSNGYRGNYILEEYGPIVHEIREFDVSFDEDATPTSHSYLMLTNTAQVVCTDYFATPYGAKFTLANASRTNAVVKGDDDVSFPGESVNQTIFIYGRVLNQDDELVVHKQDNASIRKSGLTSVTFDSPFIQTEAMANDLGDWIVDLWGGPVDEVEVEMFGNILIQVGDLVTINYPLKDMYPTTHRYFVVSVKNSFSQGLTTRLILRRARV